MDDVHELKSVKPRVARGHLEPLRARVLRAHEHAAGAGRLVIFRAPHGPTDGGVQELCGADQLSWHSRRSCCGCCGRRGGRRGLCCGCRGDRRRRRSCGRRCGDHGCLDCDSFQTLFYVKLVETDLEEECVPGGSRAVPWKKCHVLEAIGHVADEGDRLPDELVLRTRGHCWIRLVAVEVSKGIARVVIFLIPRLGAIWAEPPEVVHQVGAPLVAVWCDDPQGGVHGLGENDRRHLHLGDSARLRRRQRELDAFQRILVQAPRPTVEVVRREVKVLEAGPVSGVEVAEADGGERSL
mmetsp:Transcript_118500/g.377705  ORF Transcript_118500/g.377705 Transcript_118500/m.377705 type:complete len:296 (-) Transcript_118500:5149-6036(-)